MTVKKAVGDQITGQEDSTQRPDRFNCRGDIHNRKTDVELKEPAISEIETN